MMFIFIIQYNWLAYRRQQGHKVFDLHWTLMERSHSHQLLSGNAIQIWGLHHKTYYGRNLQFP